MRLARSGRPGWLLLAVTLVGAGQAAAQPARPAGIDFPTSATGPAQESFLRGVAALHNFEYEEAIAAFQTAQRLAPDFALAYWGEAFSYTQPLWYHEDLPRARAVLARLAPTAAARLAKAPTARERAYLSAIDALFGGGDRPARFRAAADRFAQLVRDFPDDDEARLFEALGWLGSIPEGARDPMSSERAGRLAAAVLARRPDHPGAAHYVLHAYDDGEHARLALDAARHYVRLAPASSHARHMPSHAFLPLGLWDESAAADQAAYTQSVTLSTQAGRPVAQRDYHALAWLQYACLQQGRFAKARELLAEVERALAALEAGPPAPLLSPGSTGSPGSPAAPLPLSPSLSSLPAGGGALPARSSAGAAAVRESEIGRGFDRTALRNERGGLRARLVIEAGDWAAMRGQPSFDNLDELFALGLSSVALEDYSRARAAAGELRKAAAATPERDAAGIITIMGDQVEGLLAIADGDPAQGLALLARSAQREYARPAPAARPFPAKPAGELYAEALAGLGQPAAAVREYQRVLARTPNRALALLGLARAAGAAGDLPEARRAARAFLAIWHAADPERPELTEARALAR